jgi:hypothetical protein
MDVTEGHTEVDGERDQREPRTMPDMFPKPAHRQAVVVQPQMILSDLPVRSIGSSD